MSRDLAGLVRDTVTRIDDAESAQPGPGPDWAALGARINQPRRRHRVDARAVVVGAAIAVVLIVVGVLVAAPHVGNDRADEATKTERAHWHSALYGQAVKGSLASDRTFLDAVVERLESPAPYRTDPQLKPFTPIAGTIRVEYAGDVGDHRAVLVEGEWTTPNEGRTPQEIQFWLAGPAGAAPAGLTTTDERAWPPQDDVLHRYGGSWELFPAGPPKSQTDHRPGGFIVVSAQPTVVRLVDGPLTIRADGTVNVPGDVVPMTGGVATGTVQDGSAHGTTLYIGGAARGYVSGEPRMEEKLTMSQAQRTPLRGGEVWPNRPGSTISPSTRAHLLVYFGWALAGSVMQPRDLGTFQVLAETGPPDDSGEAGRSVVGMITYPSGARALAAEGVSPRGEETGHYSVTWLMAAKIAGAGGDAGDLSIAWVAPDGIRPGKPGWSGAMGPAGTETVVWVHRDGHTTSSPAEHTLATTRSLDITQARFLDASGRELGTATVSPGLTEVGTAVMAPVAQALASS